MRWVTVLLLCSCDRLLGLHPTSLGDAYVAPPDGPFVCPDVGSGPPAYSPLVHQAIIQDCLEYTISATGNRAVAVCIDVADGSNFDVFEQTPGDAQLVRSAGIARHAAQNSYVDLPELSPDGATLWVRYTDYVNSIQTVSYSSFARQADGSWLHAMDMAVTGDTRMSSLVPIAGGYSFWLAANQASTLQEFAVVGGGAPMGGSTFDQATLLGVTQLTTLSLSPDGQRLLVHGRGAAGPGTFYTDRVGGGTFGKAVQVAGVPQMPQDPFMTAECGRIYFSDNESSIFYVQQ